MPVEVTWYIPYRVADTKFTGIVTVKDLEYVAQRFVDLLTEAEAHAPGRMVHMFYDTTECESMPPLYLMLKQAMPVLRFKTRGTMFHITRSAALRSMLELTAHVTNFKTRAFPTREEAVRAAEAQLVNDDLQAKSS